MVAMVLRMDKWLSVLQIYNNYFAFLSNCFNFAIKLVNNYYGKTGKRINPIAGKCLSGVEEW
ncbi:hypothetical protein [Segatella baroniae]|uniref:hypothetical protein n=1 Tax=Segatella baroniae TaxID=305719 RepID=UPI00138E11C9|nr:hypothetical protein [Segatella baroniae]